MRPLNFAVGLLIGMVFSSALVIAWTGPNSAPPSDNVSAPVNVGTTDQVKNSGLSVNALAVFGNAIIATVSGYLNFGSTAGANGYGIRDNAGTIEFKNDAGSWQSLAGSSSTTSLYGIQHTNKQCEASGGILRSIGTAYLCQFTGSTCPAGWTRLSNWGVTQNMAVLTGVSNGAWVNPTYTYSVCNTGGHDFANIATEACGTSGDIASYATLEAVGCY